MKISTRSCRAAVKARGVFQCYGSLYSEWRKARDGTRMYVVYSYGEHWPLFVWHDGTWYENSERYSVTTSKHRSASHPHCDTIPASCDSLKRFVSQGMDACPPITRLLAVSAG